MARVAGVDLPKNKRIDVALTYLYGIGQTNSKQLLEKLNGAIDPKTRVKDLTEQQVGLINTLLTKEYRVEGELRREIQANLQRLSEAGTYRGIRHRRNLPVRGQRTRTNARTRRGRRKTVGVGKSAEKK
jgi:small subunit ribosomal protein S13